jgi:hypothetical protein
MSLFQICLPFVDKIMDEDDHNLKIFNSNMSISSHRHTFLTGLRKKKKQNLIYENRVFFTVSHKPRLIGFPSTITFAE